MKSIEDKIYWRNFVENIIWLRKHYDFSKERMSEISGISVYELNKIEKGEVPENLSIEIVFKLSEFFSISPKDLFTDRP